ncbi:MAG: phospholipid/cholesterol/gamma-HCH transport system substrate-binding protein [Frankiales bacterium]|jgi:phospholipid/cholesterol/gamma-HCH transport system substrate-binding protein|nr:phospholipid/cholesterol/gamma-HCH transport system substrate-binding protein [Frankiales bacterium]
MKRPSWLPRIPAFREMNPQPIGAAFIAVVLVLMYVAFNITSLPLFGGGTKYSAQFSEAAGLRKGDDVRVAGVEVGTVTGVRLEGSHVRVDFTVGKGAKVGADPKLSIEIATLLGNKYILLEPGFPGEWDHLKELPLERTRAPYDVTAAFGDLSETVGAINTDQLAEALNTVSATFKNSPPQVKAALDGLSRLSRTISARDTQIGQLLRNAESVSGVLDRNRQQIVALLGDGDKLLQEIHARREVIHELLLSTASLATELRGLVRDNQAAITPALQHLKSVLDVLVSNQNNLDQILQLIFPWTRTLIDSVGTGPWFDAIVQNLPLPLLTGTAPANAPANRSLQDMLGLGG